MIPRKIHWCWVGPAPIPERHRAWMDGVRAAMPGYACRLWGNGDLPDNRFTRECLKWRKYALLSDWMRLRVLLDEGGFYLDTDVEVRKPFDPLLEHSCVLGLDPCVVEKKPVANAIMGAEPGHPFVRACVERFEAELNRRLKPPYGVKVGNQVLFAQGLAGRTAQRVGDADILEQEVLFGEYACHHFEGSWHSRKDFRAKMRSVGYRSSRAAVLAWGALTGRRMYPGEPDWNRGGKEPDA